MLEGLPEKSSVSKCCAVQTSASFNRVLACSSIQSVSNDWGVPSEYFMSSQGSLVRSCQTGWSRLAAGQGCSWRGSCVVGPALSSGAASPPRDGSGTMGLLQKVPDPHPASGLLPLGLSLLV